MDSESNEAKATRKKIRFAPKPLKREQKPLLPHKVEKTDVEEIDAAQAEQLMRLLKETRSTVKPKAEKKYRTAQVAFGHGASSSSIRSYGPLGAATYFSDGIGEKKEKEYKEPWDYNSNYPVTLPWRRPYSGNPEILDKEEFGEDTETSEIHDEEDAVNPADELGLQEENPETDLLFLQLPKNFPKVNQSGVAKPNKNANTNDGCLLNELESGFMGKMVVYKSGAVKLKMGKISYDVSPGVKCGFAQNVFGINNEDRNCTNLGELNKRAVVTPDIDSLLSSISNL